MSAERDELLRLVRQMPEEQVSLALAAVRRRLRPTQSSWPPAWFGIAEGDGTDVATHSEDLLQQG